MATPRINMRQIRNILRLKLDSKLSIRQIKTSTQISVGTIQKLLSKATELSLSWPLPESLDDNQLAQLFYPRAETSPSTTKLEIPDWSEAHQELKRKEMTLQLLWERCFSRYLACALGHSVCLREASVRYYRLSRLFLALTQSKADGSYHKFLEKHRSPGKDKGVDH